jgi:hypothetical protein
MRREDQLRGILLAHGVFDLGDRLLAVLLELVEDADEARAELGPALLEKCPINDVPSCVGHTSAPYSTRTAIGGKR